MAAYLNIYFRIGKTIFMGIESFGENIFPGLYPSSLTETTVVSDSTSEINDVQGVLSWQVHATNNLPT